MKTLSIGSAMIDTIAIIDPDRIERMSMVNADTAFLLMEEGKKTEARAVSTHLGGGAVNTGVSFARLGCEAAVLSKIGDDPRGENVMSQLSEEGVSTTHLVRTGDAPTGASVMIASHERNAAIFTFRGANTKLVEGDLDEAAFAADLVHLGSLSNESAALYPTLVEKARAAGAQISANPGMRQLTSRAQDFLNVLPKIDILMINRVEAEALTPSLVPAAGEGGALLERKGRALPKLAGRGLSGGGFEMSLRRFFEALRAITPATIVVTDGGGGAYAAKDDRLFYCPAAKAKIAGTAGAGDAFASTFAYFSASGASTGDALMAASVNASSVISYVDTQTGLLKRDEIENRKQSFANKAEIIEWTL